MGARFECLSLQDTQRAARYFSQFAGPGRCFALFGDLGFGKTTFSSFLIRELNPKIQTVTSPTFTVVQVYDSDVAEIWHVDCYRLKSQEEFYELGLEESLQNNITIIEWPEIIRDLLPSSTINIQFDRRDSCITISEMK